MGVTPYWRIHHGMTLSFYYQEPFAIRGANLNLDAEGKVESVLDAGAVLEIYMGHCEANGHGRPNVIGA
jgi:hypothetical protein